MSNPPPAPAASEWRAIDSAPKTDSVEMRAICLLGWCPDEIAPEGGDQRIIWWEPRWKGGAWNSDRDLVEHPTHWMPLPPPPGSSPNPAASEWREIDSAPKNAKEIILRVPKKSWPGFYHVVGHWAEDLSGSEQPPFRGWFYDTGYGFSQLVDEPTQWMPLPGSSPPPEEVRS